MKNKLLLFLMLLPLLAIADPVEIDGIYYNIISKANTAEVTQNPNGYYGSINIPQSVTYEGMDYNVTSISDCAFENCSLLTSIYIPNCVNNIGGAAFKDCKSLTSIEIPNSVTSIKNLTFYECSALTSIKIGNGVTTIGENAFAFCTSLTSISIPDGVSFIDDYAFRECSSLTSIKIPDSVTGLDFQVFYKCSSLISVELSNNLKKIPYQTFYECTCLTSVTIPNSVEWIQDQAFYGCNSLYSVSIGSCVEYIGNLSFANCTELKEVICYAEKNPNAEATAFDSSYPEYITLYVPDGSVNAYKSAGTWSKFKEILPIEGTTIKKHKLLYLVDNELYKSYELSEGDAITPESAPIKEGYTFSGWSDIPATMPAYDVTVTGYFIVNKYKLSYMIDGEAYKEYDVEYGAAIMPEPEPSKEGYTFSGWSEIPSTMPAKDLTITGTFTINKYKITYMIDGEEYKTERVEYGATITPPNPEEREGFNFAWEEYPSTMPAKDITINGSYTTGINAIIVDMSDVQIFDMQGNRIDKPHKGLNIIRTRDGKAKKVLVK